MNEWISIPASDGQSLKAWLTRPHGAVKGGLVIAPEIFGVNAHIRSVAEGFAQDGYLTIAPSLFDRAQPGYETGYTAADIDAGRAIIGRIPLEATLLDLAAAVARVSSAGSVGIIGYCWGGTLAWAAAARLDGLSAAICYYGGGMPGLIGEAPRCPTQCHFGEHDTHPDPAQARSLIAAHPTVDAHFYDAGHGFNCDHRASYNATAARLARERSLTFLGRHLSAG